LPLTFRGLYDRFRFAGQMMEQYEDALEVTDVNDMVGYILSLTGMSDLQKLREATIRFVLEQNMPDGVLRLPKEYGLFIVC